MVKDMNLKIERLDHQGRGISKINEKIIFIPNALPNEIVNVKIVKENKKIIEGEVIDLIEKSTNRIEASCPYYKECGGCHLMHVSYEDELNYKEEKIKQVVNKFTSYNPKLVEKIIPNNELNYRNKVTFHVDKEIGYYSNKTNNLIKIDNCLIADQSINKILSIIKSLNLSNIYEVVIRSSKSLKDKMVILKLNELVSTDPIVEKLSSDVNTIVTYYKKKYQVVHGKGFIYDKIGEYTFKISPDSFFQVNTLGAEKLYNKALEYLKPDKEDKVLDLYCGTGTIGIYISKYVKQVKGIEVNEFAVKDAIINKEINHVDNIDFLCLNASDVSKIKEKFDKIIIDPPRSGLDKKTLDYIRKSKASKIVYVSCDPITLARDIEFLKEEYELLEITPVDMFPRTYHVESVCLLKLK